MTSLATRMKESDLLAELQRIRALLDANDKKHTDMITKQQHTVNIQSAKTATASPSRHPSSYREALVSHVTSSQSS